MPSSRIPKLPIVMGEGAGTCTVSLREGVEAMARTGTVAAFGDKTTAHVHQGTAIAHGDHGRAISEFSIAIATGFGGCAIGKSLAIALGFSHSGESEGKAVHATAASQDTAFAWHAHGEARAGRIAIAAGIDGLADGLIAIALNDRGMVVARPKGTIAIAYFEDRPGRWEYPHGCDPEWIEGELFFAGLKVARVGENGIRPDYVYKLDRERNFVEVRKADPVELTIKGCQTGGR